MSYNDYYGGIKFNCNNNIGARRLFVLYKHNKLKQSNDLE